jgi:hypothetical protein
MAFREREREEKEELKETLLRKNVLLSKCRTLSDVPKIITSSADNPAKLTGRKDSSEALKEKVRRPGHCCGQGARAGHIPCPLSLSIGMDYGEIVYSAVLGFIYCRR